MLSLPDFKEKQILYIQTERGAENKIKFWNDNIRFVKDGAIINQASCFKIFAVFIIGDMSLTTAVIEKCKEYGISIFLLGWNLEEYASILAQTEGNYLLRKNQYAFTDELGFSRQLIRNKVYNQSVLLGKESKPFSFNLADFEQKLLNAKTNKELLGLEGNASKEFFGLYFQEIGWQRRLPRTKIDRQNFLLDMGYYYLFNFMDSLLRLLGFDTYWGMYHKLFFQRKSLSCDAVEPFRCIIDQQLLKSYRLGQIKESDFYEKDGRVALKYSSSVNYSRLFFEAIFAHREEMYEYVKALYRCLLNGTDEYPLFKLKKR